MQPTAGGPASPDPYLSLLPDLKRTFTPSELEALIRGRFAIQNKRGKILLVSREDNKIRLEVTVNSEWL